MAFDLSSLKRGIEILPTRMLLYGEHGLGKSTFAASGPNPVILPTEDGLGNIDVARFPLARSYADMKSAVHALMTEEHDFQLFCIDSLDWGESLIHEHVCAKEGEKNIESFGYGKGYVHAANVFREFLDDLNELRLKRGMAILFTGHAEVKRFDDPTSESYSRMTPKTHKLIAALVQEWCDVVAYAALKTFVTSEEAGFNKKVKRGVTTGERVMHLNRTPAFDAKQRYQLPDTLPLSWNAFSAALSESIQRTTDRKE